ncbi:hypothetical protein [Gilvibacter sp.]|jgi:hypothetical protein|uniref:hypothetical protein n=1 Tax=Gilvibacter sp. TaxID=2729997 RepID=UPI0035BE9AF3
MTKFFLLLILLLNISFTYGQEQQKLNIYKVVVKKMDGTRVRGYLVKVDDDGVTIDTSKRLEKVGLVVIAAADIAKIKLSRKGAVTRGALRGLAAGGALGAIAGYIDGDDNSGFISFTKEEKAVVLGTFFGLCGTVIGAIIGTNRKHFHIYGFIDEFRKYYPELQQYDLFHDQTGENMLDKN